ncbi:MAG TPA: VWA domain-containing protein [Blastocatellia bacterium]|nr:VWA domain-containing protein [Blastocatellia bacterium]
MLTTKARTASSASSRVRSWVTGSISVLLALLLATPVLSGNMSQDKKPKQDPRQRDDEPVQLHSDLVVVNLIVTDAKGQYAHGLSAGEFKVLEDGAVQPIDSFLAEEASFAAAILIDMSGSMQYKFSLARAGAASFVDHIRDNDQVAVFGFNNKIKLFQEFSDLRDITEYIWDAKAEDMTRLYDCADEAIIALEKRSEKRKAILLISDGWDTTSHKATFDSVMKKCLARGITIYSIDLVEDSERMGSNAAFLGLKRGQNEMKEFAAQTGGRYLHTPQGDKLEEAFTGIVDELRNQYTLTYYSTNQKRDGRWRKLSVAVSRPDLTTRTRKGYWAPKS